MIVEIFNLFKLPIMKLLTTQTAFSKIVAVSLLLAFLVGCKHTSDVVPPTEIKQTKNYSSEVATSWVDMQLKILQLPAGPNLFGLNPSRYFAYCGIALYESVVPGMPEYRSLAGQLTDMPSMPLVEAGADYHWPTSANAALAEINRKFFPNTSAENKASVDSLENVLNATYKSQINNDQTFQRSVAFGKEVATRIFNWSLTDGSLDNYPTYIPPVAPGLWAPTPPNFPAAAGPYWSANRLFVQGSLNGSQPAPPPPYSTDPSSAYYAMVKEVYDISQSLTPEQKDIALYYRDNPGYQAGSHYICIFNQVIKKAQPQLNITALAYAKTGIACADAFIGCWKTKYLYNIERPIRYIREVLHHPDWSPLFNTPGHPDFPSGHSANGGAVEETLTGLFGNNFQFTNHTYDYLGMTPRTYNSFSDMVSEIGKSRVYAGIHYTYSCEMGRQQGKKIAQNIDAKLKFKK
jgi:hypothetical protein